MHQSTFNMILFTVYVYVCHMCVYIHIFVHARMCHVSNLSTYLCLTRDKYENIEIKLLNVSYASGDRKEQRKGTQYKGEI